MRPGIATRHTPFFPLAGLVVAILAALAALFLLRAQAQTGGWAEHSLKVEIALGELTDRVRTIESDHRGYLLSRRPAMKAEMMRLIADLPPMIDSLALQVRDNPTQVARMAALRAAIDAKVAFAASGVAQADDGRGRDAVARVETGDGVRLMARVVALIHAMALEEERLLIERRGENDRIIYGAAASLILTIAVVLIAAAIMLRDARLRESELTVARDAAQAGEATLRAQMERIESAEAQIRQMQKMEAIGQLTGGIAHDFNNMLAIVIGSLDLAKRRLHGDPEKLERCIANAYEGAERAAALTARLLAFSRQQPLAPLTLDVNKLVSGMSELLRRTMGEQYMVETVLAGGLWRTFVDPGQLENALLNLAVNARDAMPGGGRMTIETANAHLDDEYARGRAEVVPGQYVLISVTDTGTGMTPEVMARAFDPFFTTKPVGKGTGLGLSQIFGFVKQTGGHVAIYSEQGHGTTLKLYLPRAHGAVEVQAPLQLRDNVAPEARPGEMILVVEDDQRVRHFSVDALRELGYVVLSASGGAEALTLLGETPQVTLLFTDIMMPGMDGRKLADAALVLRSDLKVLFTTGYTRNAVVHNGMLDAGVAFLAKPFTVAQLAIKIREVLNGGGVNRPV